MRYSFGFGFAGGTRGSCDMCVCVWGGGGQKHARGLCCASARREVQKGVLELVTWPFEPVPGVKCDTGTGPTVAVGINAEEVAGMTAWFEGEAGREAVRPLEPRFLLDVLRTAWGRAVGLRPPRTPRRVQLRLLRGVCACRGGGVAIDGRAHAGNRARRAALRSSRRCGAHPRIKSQRTPPACRPSGTAPGRGAPP